MANSPPAWQTGLTVASDSSILLRAPRPGEYQQLDALCRRSKATWGYDEAFLDQCRDVLQVNRDLAETGLVIVAERRGTVVGVAQIECDGDSAELDLMFVEPDASRAGIGRRLFGWATQTATERGAKSLKILSDPGARPFYEAMGAEFVAMAPSDAIENRELPLLSLRLR